MESINETIDGLIPNDDEDPSPLLLKYRALKIQQDQLPKKITEVIKSFRITTLILPENMKQAAVNLKQRCDLKKA